MHQHPQSSSSSSSPLSLFSRKESKHLLCLLATSLISLIFILSFRRPHTPSSSSSLSPPDSSSSSSSSLLYSRFRHHHPNLIRPNSNNTAATASLPPPPPSIAYLISGSNGDSTRMLRLLYAVYHPKNHYLLHLDRSAPQEDRDELAVKLQSVPLFRTVGNVNVIGKADVVNFKGSTPVAAVLHGAAILLRHVEDWDWFINLSAADYPLITQDDLLHLMSFLPRDLSFIQHSSHIGLKEYQKLRPIIVDPGLYHLSKSEVFYATQRREMPNAYKFFAGSAFVMLSRKFIDFCIVGTDNLPRTLLMYYTNVPFSHESYFHTVACNSRDFRKTIVNGNLHYVVWDSPLKWTLSTLGLDHFDNITESGAAFARPFKADDPVLDKIDMEILNSGGPGKVVPGGWCLGKENHDPCLVWGEPDILKPGPGAKRLEKFLVRSLSEDTFHSQQCAADEERVNIAPPIR